MTIYHFFNNTVIHLTISSEEGTKPIVEELVRLLGLAPSEGPGAVHVHLYSMEHPSDEVVRALQDGNGPSAGRWHNVQDRFTVHENHDRSLLLCGVRLFPWWYPTRETVRDLVSMLLRSVLSMLSNRLLLIHGALVTDGERGFVLAGPSGAGKTTAAARVPLPWRAPADDLVAAVPSEPGYSLYPVPTWSRIATDPGAFRAPPLDDPSPLSGILFLEQSESDLFQPVSKNEAIQRLLADSYQVFQLNLDEFTEESRFRCRKEVLLHVARVVDRVPCGILSMTRNGQFWDHFPIC